ncbi:MULTISPECIES: flagellar hook capping FlgD N-terminal domain-containing protein [unclassified Sporolactobacillus]|uniref:flagellar hook capping FlgD N-terminal domain-containing protein n=1 Tax=unclassified Sporolactobacillus TaxID=2628533 RepID=UPI002368AA5F|nr:flagellar hook capping FlgD N-terminal domain-containing protein [Sporolactobacillus sp. CQH2019]MDD9147060.1 flagellar hook capping FlgD N-terminal domain-containing protein [Sporolactobacillus sp. CQH2019]
MSTSPTTAAGSASAVSSSSSSTLNKDDFLKLLVAQLTNQDPTSPMDDTQMVSQLAQFSALEQTQNVATAVNQLVAVENNNSLSSQATIIGKEITWQPADDGSSDTTPGPASDIVKSVTLKDGQISYITNGGQSVDPSTVTEISDSSGSKAS